MRSSFLYTLLLVFALFCRPTCVLGCMCFCNVWIANLQWACCSFVDLNGDSLVDQLVGCANIPGVTRPAPYAELINTGTGFCLRNYNDDYTQICGGCLVCTPAELRGVGFNDWPARVNSTETLPTTTRSQ